MVKRRFPGDIGRKQAPEYLTGDEKDRPRRDSILDPAKVLELFLAGKTHPPLRR